MPDDAGADTAEPPPDAETKRLVNERRRAEARAGIAEARKKELQAMLPDLKAEVPSATLDPGEEASSIAELLAYAELDAAAGKVVEWIQGDLGSLAGARVLLVRSLDLSAAHGQAVAVATGIAGLRDAVGRALVQFEQETPTGRGQEVRVFGILPMVAATAASLPVLSALASTVVGALPTVLSLTATNTTIRQRKFDLKESAVLAALAHRLTGAGSEVTVEGFSPVPRSGLIEEVEQLRQDRDRLAERQLAWQHTEVDVAEAAKNSKEADLAGLRKRRDDLLVAEPPRDTADLDRRIAEAEGELSRAVAELGRAKFRVGVAERVGEATDTFLAAASAVPEGQTVSPLASAALWREYLPQSSAPSGPEHFVVSCEAVFAAGESRYDERSLRADKLQHHGGVGLSFVLVDAGGRVRSSGVTTRLGVIDHEVGRTRFERFSSSIGALAAPEDQGG